LKVWPLVREILLCVCGLAGVAYEAIIQNAERPTLLLTYMGMMGLSAVAPMVRLRNGSSAGGG
jgi:predicted membrane channel-forming protein YqfA (hemolysin III family)